ncbi:MAG: MFS transporter [Candidatus Korobacteraceae bacterium]
MEHASASSTDVGTAASRGVQGQKRTSYRWAVLFMIAMMALITFMDRTNISIAAPRMSKDFGLSKTQMGFVFSAFAWAYALGQLPGGWITDKLGSRKVLTLVVLFWSMMTMATAHALGFISLVVIRFIFGLGEAASWPAGTQAMQYWYPKSERGLVNGVTHSCGQFATSIVPLLGVAIMTAWGWRSIFHIFGTIGIVWAIGWWMMYRERPEQHKRVNAAEAAYIRDGAAIGGPVKKKVDIPWKLILTCPATWILGFAWSAYTYTAYFFWYWLPTYLLEFRHISLKNMGYLAPLPLFAGAVGVVAGGIITDYAYKKTGNLKWSRRGICIVAMVGSALFAIPAGTMSKAVPVVICLILCNFFVSLCSAATWAVSIDIAGGYAGSVSAIMNMIAQLVGSLSAIVFGVLVQRGYWVAPFYLTSAVTITSALLWAFAINPERSVLERS